MVWCKVGERMSAKGGEGLTTDNEVIRVRVFGLEERKEKKEQ